jgi:hypothetical protein
MLLQHRIGAVVGDGVEVAVEPGLAGGQPEPAQRGDQAGQELVVGLAADPPGVGAQVGGLGQGGQAQGERQAFVVGERAWNNRKTTDGCLPDSRGSGLIARRLSHHPAGGVNL